MKNITKENLSEVDTKAKLHFEASNYAALKVSPGIDGTCVGIESDKDYAWDRDALKELITFLKAVRKGLPK